MALSEEDQLLLNDNCHLRIYGSLDDSYSSDRGSDTLLSSGSFQVNYVDKVNS